MCVHTNTHTHRVSKAKCKKSHYLVSTFDLKEVPVSLTQQTYVREGIISIFQKHPRLQWIETGYFVKLICVSIIFQIIKVIWEIFVFTHCRWTKAVSWPPRVHVEMQVAIFTTKAHLQNIFIKVAKVSWEYCQEEKLLFILLFCLQNLQKTFATLYKHDKIIQLRNYDRLGLAKIQMNSL